ncbi:MAG TPA: hypothetical protein VF139_12380 [Candidatus Polarisedimenticolaceae bacterium]
MIAVAIDALAIRIEGLRPDEEAEFRWQWGRFRVEPPSDPWILAKVTHRSGEPAASFDAKELRVVREPATSLVTMPGVRARVPDEGPLAIEVEGDDPGRNAMAVINVLHATIAWRIVERGGLLLHAASAVLDGRGFVLVGAEGAGKSTWARGMAAAGALALGDDIALVLPSASGFDLVGSPLRAKELDGGTPGRWPLAAILLPRHAARASLTPATRLEVHAALAANLPFATDRGIEPFLAVTEALARTPARRLAFTRTDAGASLLSTMTA